MCSPWWLCNRMISSLVRRGLISYPIKKSYPCSLGLMGCTSHLINRHGNEDRDHSSSDGRIIVSTMLPILGWTSLTWDQWYWYMTSCRSCTYYDTDFGSLETSLGLVVQTVRLTSGQWRAGLWPVRVVHTMKLTSGQLGLVWDQWYTLWDWWYWCGTSSRSGSHYEAEFGSVETILGPVVCTLILNLS